MSEDTVSPPGKRLIGRISLSPLSSFYSTDSFGKPNVMKLNVRFC